jgi:hypothetical protein
MVFTPISMAAVELVLGLICTSEKLRSQPVHFGVPTMICRTAIALFALAYCVPAQSSEPVRSLQLSKLAKQQSFNISTAERKYQVILVDPVTGESLVRSSLNGETFGQAERMFIVGASSERQPHDGAISVVFMGEIREGMCIEWGKGSLDHKDRGTTTPIRGISFVER